MDWTNNRGQVKAYIFPIRLISPPLPYGLHVEVQLQPEKDLYMPGEEIQAT